MNGSGEIGSILFICTGNCCRSQMAEALLRHTDRQRFHARSAGTHPTGYIHPLVHEVMRRLEVPLEGQYSKRWEDMARQEHTAIITLCDLAACQPPPRWAGNPARAHWSLADPSHLPGGEQARVDAAMETARRLQSWIDALIRLPTAQMSPAEFETELRRIPTQ